ncbi:hypothetical protein [Leuconostoc mesenteroides]|uniref:hypothetical protein n=1 Tax=Leuconostoc mesenteroides TaxID=1245 RepID=UPI00112ACB12|nr:hypothetical protein [Leuconostoc mesenteroides]TPF02340.1 hypothetical protein DIS10_07165 [Leuconostoc mesenteroides]
MNLENKLRAAKSKTDELLQEIKNFESIENNSDDMYQIDVDLFFTLSIYGACLGDLFYKRRELKISNDEEEQMNAWHFANNKAKHETIFEAISSDEGFGSIVGQARVGQATIGTKTGIVWSQLKIKESENYEKYLSGKKISITIKEGFGLIEKYYQKLIELSS